MQSTERQTHRRGDNNQIKSMKRLQNYWLMSLPKGWSALPKDLTQLTPWIFKIWKYWVWTLAYEYAFVLPCERYEIKCIHQINLGAGFQISLQAEHDLLTLDSSNTICRRFFLLSYLHHPYNGHFKYSCF